MSDNTTLNSGSGGDIIATDDIGGVKYQRVKVTHGADGSATDVSTASPMPVTLANTGANSTAVTVGGTAAADAAVSGNPIQAGARASAAAPTDMSADGDAVPIWALRSGAVAVQPTLGGVLAVAGNGASSTAVPRVTLANDSTGNIATIGTSVTPGTSAAHLGKAEDAAAVSGDTGVAVLAVRRDSASSGVSADGDYANLSVDSTGALRVSGASGTTQYAEDVASAGGESLCLVGTVRQDTLASSTSTDGDYAYAKSSSTGALYVNVAEGGITARAEDAAASGGEDGLPILAVRRDTPSSGVSADGDWGNLSIDSNGALRTIAQANTNTQEVVGDVAQDAAISGNPVSIGLRGSTAIPSAMSADGDSVYAWADLNGAIIVAGRIVDDAAFTPGTSRVQPIGFQADETATDSVDEGDAGCPRMTLDRKVIVTPYTHAAAGGHTPYKNLDVDETEDDIKTSAGKLFWLHVVNLANAKRYLHIYNNVAASVTVGTTVPDLTFPIPTMGDTNGAGFCIHFGDAGLAFGTGICIAATTGFADNDSGAPGANEIILNAGYL